MTKETFEKQGIVVKLEKLDNCLAQLDISLDSNAVAKCHKEAVKLVNKSISIPGFRKGKAPDSSVLERYPSHIEQEFRDLVIQEAFEQAIGLSKVYPIRKESIHRPKIITCSKEEGAHIIFTFEVRPTLPEIDFSKITLPTVDADIVSEDQIQEVVGQIQQSYATYEEIPSRPIQENDFIALTVHAEYEDGNRYPVVEGRRFKVDDKMQPWLHAMVLGMEVGEEKKGHTSAAPDATEEEKADYKEMAVTIKVDRLLEMKIPPFDDEFAKKVGASTTDQVLTRIRQNLEHQAAQKQKDQRIKFLEQALLDHYPIVLPPSIVGEETRERVKQRLASLKSLQLQGEELKKREEEIEAETSKEAERALRLYFIQDQIARQGEIVLTDEEFQEIVKESGILHQNEGEEAMRHKLDRLRNLAYQRKVDEYALSKVL